MDGWNALHACGKCRLVFYILGRVILSPFGVGPVYSSTGMYKHSSKGVLEGRTPGKQKVEAEGGRGR